MRWPPAAAVPTSATAAVCRPPTPPRDTTDRAGRRCGARPGSRTGAGCLRPAPGWRAWRLPTPGTVPGLSFPLDLIADARVAGMQLQGLGLQPCRDGLWCLQAHEATFTGPLAFQE